MRNIRIADRSDWATAAPLSKRRRPRSRLLDWIATVPLVLLLPALALPYVSAVAGGPTLTVTPSSPAAGATVTMTGSGFAKRQTGVIQLDTDEIELGEYKSNGEGRFKVRVALPRSMTPGEHEATAESADGQAVASVILTIDQPPTPRPEPTPTPKRAPTPKSSPKPTPALRSSATTKSTSTSTPTPSPEPTSSPKPTPAPSSSATAEPTPTPRPEPTSSPEPTPSPTTAGTVTASGTILIDRATLMSLPTSGSAWAALKDRADLPAAAPNLSNQNDPNDVTALAKALVYARTGVVKYRDETITMLKAAVGTEYPGDTLGVARGVAPLVLAADLVDWRDPAWMSWLNKLRTWANPDRGYTLISMHEKRPNNWGTHAGAGRIAADLYLGDMTDLARAAKVFRGYLGDRSAYASFTYGSDLSWQANPLSPVGINPAGASISGVTLDGIMPDDMRRGGSRPVVGDLGQSYTWEALQGTLLQAELLSRNGYPAWEWQQRAILRAFSRIHALGYPAVGDDRWQPWLLNRRYGTTFPASTTTTAGKSFGYADWLYGR